MIKNYTQKIFFVDEPLLEEVNHSSLSEYNKFTQPDIDTQVITLPLESGEVDALVEYIDPSEIRVGNVLAKAGYTNQFVPISDFSKDHVLRKYRLWLKFCLALGAKKVSIESAENVSLEAANNSSISASIHGKTTMGEADAKLENNTSSGNDEVRKEIMDIKAEAAGSDADIVTAEKILNDHKLKNDDMFTSIFEMRKLTLNPVLSHEFTLDFSKDLKRVFDSSTKARLNVISKFFDGAAEVDMAKSSLNSSQSAIRLSVKIDF